MQTFLERIKTFFSSFGQKTKSEPKVESAVNEPSTSPKPEQKPKADRFMMVSWGITIFVVIILLGSTLYYKSTLPPTVMTAPSQATEASSGTGQPQVGDPTGSEEGSGFFPTILRELQLKTNIP